MNIKIEKKKNSVRTTEVEKKWNLINGWLTIEENERWNKNQKAYI